MKKIKSTSTSGWRKQKTFMISSNEVVDLVKTSASIVQMYFPT
jgi:hypothetical protein